MVEIRNGKKVLITPISEEDLRDIRIGDVIYLDGTVVTGRDMVHRRVVKEGLQIPVDIHDAAVMHAGPITRKTPDGGYEMVAIGPTTSSRMEMFEKDFRRITGVRVVIGKGGMGEDTMEGCRTYGALHCVYPAGNAVLAAVQTKRIRDVHWEDLGMPEALWHFEVEAFGPLIVSIDTHGGNFFEQQKVIYNERKEEALANICKEVGFIK